VTCYFFPEGVDTSDEQMLSGGFFLLAIHTNREEGSNFLLRAVSKILRTIKSVHHVDDEIIKKKCVKMCQI